MKMENFYHSQHEIPGFPLPNTGQKHSPQVRGKGPPEILNGCNISNCLQDLKPFQMHGDK